MRSLALNLALDIEHCLKVRIPCVDTLRVRIVTEEAEGQARLPTPANARDDLGHATVHAVDKPVEISASPDFDTYLSLIPD